MNKTSVKKNPWLNEFRNSEDVASLFELSMRDAQFMDELESETILESLFLSECKIAPYIKNLSTPDEWKQLLENAIEQKQVEYTFVKKRTLFNARFRLAAAACLIAATTILFNGIFQHYSVKNRTDTASVTNNKQKSIKAQSYASYNNIHREIQTSDSRSSILMLDRKTSGIMGRRSHITVEKRDTSVYLSLSSGAVLFTVEKNRYKSFTVVTPHAKIRVTGTTFRVETTVNMTEVSVMEGCVKVIHCLHNNKDTTSLFQGNIAVADSLTVKRFENRKDFELCFPKRALLDNFINGSASHGNGLPETITEHSADSILSGLRLGKNISDNLYNVYNAAIVFEKKARLNDAIELYEYILDNSDSSELRNNAASNLTWSLIRLKTGNSENKLHLTGNTAGNGNSVDFIRLFPKKQFQP